MKEILYSTKFLNLMASKRDEKADWVYAKRPNAKNVVIIAPVIHKEDGNYGGVITDRVEVKLDKIKDFIEKIQNENMYMCAQTLAGVYFLTLLK